MHCWLYLGLFGSPIIIHPGCTEPYTKFECSFLLPLLSKVDDFLCHHTNSRCHCRAAIFSTPVLWKERNTSEKEKKIKSWVRQSRALFNRSLKNNFEFVAQRGRWYYARWAILSSVHSFYFFFFQCLCSQSLGKVRNCVCIV